MIIVVLYAATDGMDAAHKDTACCQCMVPEGGRIRCHRKQDTIGFRLGRDILSKVAAERAFQFHVTSDIDRLRPAINGNQLIELLMRWRAGCTLETMAVQPSADLIKTAITENPRS
jgi:hypothetical protein